MVFLRCSLVALAILATGSVADAQIYTWRDASGTLMMADTAPTDAAAEVRTFKVARSTESIRVTKPVSSAYRDNYDDLIVKHAQANNLRPDLVRAVVQVESGYNPGAVSPKGAMGLMQLMPTTASQLGVRAPFDPEENIRGGTSYLRQLLDRFAGERGTRAGCLQRRADGGRPLRREGAALPGNARLRSQGEDADHRRHEPASSDRSTTSGSRASTAATVVRYSDTPPASGPYTVVDPSRY